MAKPGHIYHWKHGWIPITPRAAMIKAKGSHTLGARYMHRYGVHDSRVGEAERRTERVGEGPAGRGSFRYVKGTKTRDYPDRAPVGRPAGDLHPDEAFRMGKKELAGHAAGGSKVAQAELDRRAAKHGRPSTPPARHPDAPKPTTKPSTPPARHPDAPAPAPHTPTKPLAEHDDRELAREVYRRGGTVGADGRFYPGTASRDVRPGDRNPTLENYGDDELARELHRRGGAVDTNGNHVPGGSAGAHTPTGESMGARLAREDVDISAALPEGHIVSARQSGDGVYSRHLTTDSHQGRTAGVVTGSDATGYEAFHYTYRPKSSYGTRNSLGTFSTRLEAHQAVAKAHVAAKAAEAEKAAKAAKAAERKAAKLAGIAGPHGTTWQPHTLDDGTFSGRAAAAKAKQAYKAGGHTVVIETALSDAETKGLLGDITSALERTHPNLKGTGVKFLVPTGDSTFRASGGGVVGAYVHRGGTTVHINPGVANNKYADAFARGGKTGHFMPAANDVAPREYTILHELGHVAHNVHGHVAAGPFSPPDEALRHVSHSHSKYGRSSPFEGYAEAFAQHSIAGNGSHPVSDAYAEHYGWAAPGKPLRDASGTALTDARRTLATAAPPSSSDIKRAFDPGGRYQLKDAQATRRQPAAQRRRGN